MQRLKRTSCEIRPPALSMPVDSGMGPESRPKQPLGPSKNWNTLEGHSVAADCSHADVGVHLQPPRSQKTKSGAVLIDGLYDDLAIVLQLFRCELQREAVAPHLRSETMR